MTILNGGGSSGVSPKNFNQGIEDVKNAVQDVQTSVNSLSSTMQSGMSDLQDSVEESLEQVQTAVENIAVGVPAPSLYSLTAQSMDDGIQLSYSAHTGTSADGGEMSTGELVPLSVTKGVMFRYKEGAYPTHRNDGTLAFTDEDLFNVGSGGGKVKKTKTQTVVGLTNGKTYYFTAFPYSTYNLYNESMGSKNCISCAWTGTKGTLTIDVTQDFDVKELGEITVTLTPTAGGDAVTGSRTGPGEIVLSLDGGEYTLSFSAETYFTTPASQKITVLSGQSNAASAEYKAVKGLSNYTWEEVYDAVRKGAGGVLFSVGERKKTTVGCANTKIIRVDGSFTIEGLKNNSLDATIVGMDMHENIENPENPNKNITFCVLDMPLYCSEADTTPSWKDSYTRIMLNEKYKESVLPEIHQYITKVKNVIAGFDHVGGDNSSNPWIGIESNDYIYVPSMRNVGSYDEPPGETIKYPYFSSNEERKLTSFDSDNTSGNPQWWATSTRQGRDGTLVDIRDNGQILYSNGYSKDATSETRFYMPICFNIG